MEGDVFPMEGCTCASCKEARRRRYTPEADQRAEQLLRRYLSEQQVFEWEQSRSIVVRGSHSSLFRLTPSLSGFHDSVVREDGLGIAVWPIGLDIAADWTLAMMLRIEANENKVVSAGCHYVGREFRPPQLPIA